MAVRRVGQWDRARRVLRAGGGPRMHRAINLAVRREAQRLRREIVVGLRKGSKEFEPLSPLTRAARRLSGFRGGKPLIRSGELRNSISVVARGDRAFVGVPRKAGDKLVRIAEIHEYGTQPFVIPITPKMRKFLGALFSRERGRRKRRRGSSGPAGVVVIQIPARPFLRTAFDRWKKSNPQRRMLAEIAKDMGWT